MTNESAFLSFLYRVTANFRETQERDSSNYWKVVAEAFSFAEKSFPKEDLAALNHIIRLMHMPPDFLVRLLNAESRSIRLAAAALLRSHPDGDPRTMPSIEVKQKKEFRKDGWRKLTELYREWEIRPATNDVKFLISAGILEKMSQRSKFYRVKNREAWSVLCHFIRENLKKV